MDGWLKIHRKITDNPLWNCEPFTRGQAWVDLILIASFSDTFFYVRGIKIEQKRGQVCWSEPKLADRWRWSRSKLRKFLNDLEKEQQIIQQKNNVTQVITIVNYDEYQEKEQQTGQQKDSKRTAERQQKDVIEECKEIKECKEDIISRYQLEFFNDLIPFVDEFGKDTCREFYDYWTEPNPSKTKIKWQLEKTWDFRKRLTRWSNNNFKKSNGTKENFRTDAKQYSVAANVKVINASD